MRQLQERGTDVLHVADVGLRHADDARIFAWAASEDRIIVTRNYRDFAPLVVAAARQRRRFPGVLFCAPALTPSDVGGHIRAIERWLAEARAAGDDPVAGSYGWLSP